MCRTEVREMKSGMMKVSRVVRVEGGRVERRERRVVVKDVVRAWGKYIFVETARRGRLPERGETLGLGMMGRVWGWWLDWRWWLGFWKGRCVLFTWVLIPRQQR